MQKEYEDWRLSIIIRALSDRTARCNYHNYNDAVAKFRKEQIKAKIFGQAFDDNIIQQLRAEHYNRTTHPLRKQSQFVAMDSAKAENHSIDVLLYGNASHGKSKSVTATTTFHEILKYDLVTPIQEDKPMNDSTLITKITNKVYTVGVVFQGTHPGDEAGFADGTKQYVYKSMNQYKIDDLLIVKVRQQIKIVKVVELNAIMNQDKDYKWIQGTCSLRDDNIEDKETKIIKRFKKLEWEHANKRFLKDAGIDKSKFDKLVKDL